MIEKFRSVFGSTVKLTQSGIDHMLKRHPELKDLNLVVEIGLAVEDLDYIVEGKFGRHIAVRIQPQMKTDKAKYMAEIYKEKAEVITLLTKSNYV